MRYLLFFLTILVFFRLDGQSNAFKVQNYTIEDGLSQNSVYSITQSSDGMLWLGTNDGLNSFDGNQFKVYWPEKIGDYTRSSIIYTVASSVDNLLWVGTSSELLIFDPITNVFCLPNIKYKNFTLPDRKGVNKIYRDKKDRMWVLTISEGIFMYDIKKNKSYKYFGENDTKNIVTDITEDQDGIIFLSTEKAIYSYKNNLEKINLKGLSVNKQLNIREILYHQDRLLIGNINDALMKASIIGNNAIVTSNIKNGSKSISVMQNLDEETVLIGGRVSGIQLYNASKNSYKYISDDKQMNDLFVLDIFKASNGIIYAGTSGKGFFKFEKYKHQFQKGRWEKAAINATDNMVFSIYSDSDEDYYFGSLNSGLIHYSISKGEYKRYINFALPVESRNIYGIADIGNDLWMASWAGLCKFNKTTKKISLYKDEKRSNITELYSVLPIEGMDWILVSGEKGMDWFNSKTLKYGNPFGNTKLPFLIVRKMQQKSSNEIWMSTANENFIIYNFKNNTVRKFPQFNNLANYSCDFVVDNNSLYIATNKGLIESDTFNFEVNEFWTIVEGLPNNYVYALQSDGKNGIWMSTNNGICKLNKSDHSIHKYTVNDGLQNAEFNTASSFKSKSGMLFFGGIDGFNYFDPTTIVGSQHNGKVFITNIKIHGKVLASTNNYSTLEQLELLYDQNFISFGFISPNAIRQDELKYKYKLIGLDQEWVESDGRLFANYTSLPPGEYEFCVKTYNNSKEINPTTCLKVNILQVWWKQAWFVLLFIGALVSAFTYYFMSRWKSIKEKNSLNLKLSKLEFAALQSSLHPHFIFNTLNGISSMITLQEYNQAQTYLQKFSKYLRSTLESSNTTYITLKKSLSDTSQYIELEKLRIPDLEVGMNIDFDLDLSKILVPVNLLQPLIEIAIWQGLTNKHTSKKLIIEILQFTKEVTAITILHNGTMITRNTWDEKTINEINNYLKKVALIEKIHTIEVRLDINEEANETNVMKTFCTLHIISKSEKI